MGSNKILGAALSCVLSTVMAIMVLSPASVNAKSVVVFVNAGGNSASAVFRTNLLLGQPLAGPASGAINTNLFGGSPYIDTIKGEGVVAANLHDVYVYPNPYKPGTGSAYDFPFNNNLLVKGVVFNNLPKKCKIQIFDISGQLVYEKDKDDWRLTYQWDTKNHYNSEVASGVYIYLITAPGVKKTVGKFSIIR